MKTKLIKTDRNKNRSGRTLQRLMVRRPSSREFARATSLTGTQLPHYLAALEGVEVSGFRVRHSRAKGDLLTALPPLAVVETETVREETRLTERVSCTLVLPQWRILPADAHLGTEPGYHADKVVKMAVKRVWTIGKETGQDVVEIAMPRKMTTGRWRVARLGHSLRVSPEPQEEELARYKLGSDED